MKKWLYCLMSVCMLALPGWAASLTRLDSLRQLGRWPLTVQLAVATRRVTPATAPLVGELVRRPGVPRAVRVELLANLAGHYLHENQPSLAIIQMLQTRRMALADHDSSRLSTACEWLCYAYSLLKDPRPGLRYGQEALRTVPAHDPDQARRLTGIYFNLADCAALIPDYPLAARYYRQALRLTRQTQDSANTAVALASLATYALRQQQLPQAAQLLDSAYASYLPPRYLGVQLVLDLLRGTLARQQGQYTAAVQWLEPARARARQARQLNDELQALKELVPALSQLGRYREALVHQQRLTVLRDSMFEESSARHAREMHTLYQTQEKEQQLTRLRLRTQARETLLRQRTLLFVGVLVGVGLLVTLVIVRQRARHILATTAEALRVRNRIAADLHDEVGTLLTRVSLQAELLRQTQPAPQPALDRLLTNSRAAAGTMRDIVWSIDAEADTVGALLDRMRDHLDQTAVPAGLETHLEASGLHDHNPIAPVVRQHLYLVFKEAVTNAARHARGATQVQVKLEKTPGTLQLTVLDDAPAASAPAPRSGMGLRNMRQRAEALCGQLQAGPMPGGGFRVQLRLPA
ncbi:histidine kinase [Hymenobacter sp. J193]|uniref:sensor histidine kinase n=1 Tax=Hymenobacter sp. J193 TaxID=2898429 RepID=UPI0021514273|nr:ATP-binding protein [Hymenobacter sp. J193]MCR5889261.1 histidine kinase [Hymenobacter sp. J193]